MSERDSDTQYITVESLGRIRDSALLLLLGNAYLCEEPFLKKIGHSINVDLEKLKEDISFLKGKFPGKFTREVDTDEIIKEIHSTAQSLMEPDDKLNERCTVGELGRDLESNITTLSDAIQVIRRQVDGSSATYSKKDYVFKFAGGFKGFWRFPRSVVIMSIKILLGLILIAILPFAYLFLTMETEGNILKEMTKSQAQIQIQEDIISQIDQRREEISQRIRSLEKGMLSRQDKVEIMDLEIEINKINEERERAEYEVSIQKKQVMEFQRKIKELQTTPFTKRFFQHMKNVVPL